VATEYYGFVFYICFLPPVVGVLVVLKLQFLDEETVFEIGLKVNITLLNNT